MRIHPAARRLLMLPVLVATCLTLAGVASAQVERPDYRVRASLRTPANGAWGEKESVGNAEFRIQSRYLQVYYGGVRRSDEFKFNVEISFTDISDFETEFATSPYNSNYDIYIENGYVGRAIMGLEMPGVALLEYDSRHPEFPSLPLPSNFPEPVDVGQRVRIYFAAATAPAVGDPLPTGTPVFSSLLEERDRRGDVNLDGKVDEDDFAVLAATFDPTNAFGPHIGPNQGDFTGDNRSDTADYTILSTNWTSNSPVPVLLGALGVGNPLGGGSLRLAANQPNPFRGSTTIRMSLAHEADVQLDVYNLNGARVAQVQLGHLAAGPHDVVFDGRDAGGRVLPNGTYFYRVQAGAETAARRMVLMK